jgi:hypothetical protein
MHIVFAMGALGALLGVWIAWSQSPVVVTVIPLLFGVIGSAGGYSLLKMDFSKPQNKEKLKVISVALGTLCLSCLLFMFAAIMSRPFLAALISRDEVDVSTLSSPLRAIMLRARLQALGAAANEIKFILKPPVSRLPDADQVDALAKDADEYIKAYDAVSVPDKSAFEVGFSDVNPGTIANWCRIFLLEKAALSGGKAPDDYQSALLMSRFATVSVETRTGNTENERQKTLIKYPQLVAARIKLFSDLQASRRLTAVVSSTQEIEDADKVLQILAKSSAKTREPVEIGMVPNRAGGF